MLSDLLRMVSPSPSSPYTHTHTHTHTHTPHSTDFSYFRAVRLHLWGHKDIRMNDLVPQKFRKKSRITESIQKPLLVSASVSFQRVDRVGRNNSSTFQKNISMYLHDAHSLGTYCVKKKTIWLTSLQIWGERRNSREVTKFGISMEIPSLKVLSRK